MPSNINWKERYLYIKVFIKLELWLSYFALHLSSKCGFSLSQSADFSFKNALPLLLIFLHTFPIVFHDVKFILIVASKKCATEPGTSDTSRSMPCSNNKAPTHSCVITQTNRAETFPNFIIRNIWRDVKPVFCFLKNCDIEISAAHE